MVKQQLQHFKGLIKAVVCLALTSCVLTEMVYNENEAEFIDTSSVFLHKSYKSLPVIDTTEVSDTTSVPIKFDPSVEDWD